MLVERAARFTLKIEHTKKSRFSTYYAIKLDYFLSIVPDEFFLIPLDLISLTEQKKIFLVNPVVIFYSILGRKN